VTGAGVGSRYQNTLGVEFSCSGVGCHSGDICNIIISPAEENTGIVFRRRGLGDIQALVPYVYCTKMCTGISSGELCKVYTIEHLLAALKARNIDNAIVSCDAEEPPFLCGNSAGWDSMILESGVKSQNAMRNVVTISCVDIVEDGIFWLKIEPADSFSIDVSIMFDHPAVGEQSYIWDEKKNSFSDISHASTFGFMKDKYELHSNGFALGVTLGNSIIIGDTDILNEELIYYEENSFARHKVLDILGDSALLGVSIVGKISGYGAGHSLTYRLMKKVWDRYNIQNLAPMG